MARRRSLSLLAPIALATACTTAPPGVVSVQVRGAIYSSDVFEAVAVVLGGYDDGSASESEPGSGSSSHYQSYAWSDIVNASWGARAAISISGVDLVGGIDRHWYDDQDQIVTEKSIGLRFRQNSDAGIDYVQLLFRRGSDLETDDGEKDYDGMSVGVGAITPIGRHWFVDASIEAEWTFREFEVDGDDTHLFSAMLNVGLGFSP